MGAKYDRRDRERGTDPHRPRFGMGEITAVLDPRRQIVRGSLQGDPLRLMLLGAHARDGECVMQGADWQAVYEERLKHVVRPVETRHAAE
jgi:hypothetical protein